MSRKPYLSFINSKESFRKSGRTRQQNSNNKRTNFFVTRVSPLLPFLGKLKDLCKELGINYKTASSMFFNLKKDGLLCSSWVTFGNNRYHVYHTKEYTEEKLKEVAKEHLSKKNMFYDNSTATQTNVKKSKTKYDIIIRKIMQNREKVEFNISECMRIAGTTRYYVEKALMWGMENKYIGLLTENSICDYFVKNMDSPFWYNANASLAKEKETPEAITHESLSPAISENQINRQSDVSTWPQIKPASA